MSLHKVMTPSSNTSRGRRSVSVMSPSSEGKFTRLEFEDDAVWKARKNLHKKLAELERVIKLHTTPRKEGSLGVGAGNPMIIAAKKELQRLKNQEKQLRWTALVCWHKQNIEEAELEVKQGGDLEILNRAVQEACDSDLGPGHHLCMAGKRALTVIAKARQNEAIKRKTEMERIRLKKAMDSMEVAVLDKAIEKATQRIGRGHLYVQQALEHRKSIVFEEKHRAWHELVESFKQAIAKAFADNDLKMLEYWIREADQSGLGPGHRVVMQGKKWLDTLNKRRKLAKYHVVEAEAQKALSVAMNAAKRALDNLELEVAHETQLENVYLGRGGHLHLNE